MIKLMFIHQDKSAPSNLDKIGLKVDESLSAGTYILQISTSSKWGSSVQCRIQRMLRQNCSLICILLIMHMLTLTEQTAATSWQGVHSTHNSALLTSKLSDVDTKGSIPLVGLNTGCQALLCARNS